jgi:hypothetical protein
MAILVIPFFFPERANLIPGNEFLWTPEENFWVSGRKQAFFQASWDAYLRIHL